MHAGATVTGLDFSERMLERARAKSSEVEWVQGDAQQLPFEDASFDAATVGFGVRNLDDLERGLAELRRVLKPGGRVAILEITKPSGLLAPFYRLWFDGFVPLLGKVLPGGAAYTYLPASVRRFPGPDELAGLLRGAGFEDVRWRTFAGGIVALHIGMARSEPGDDSRDARARRLPRRSRSAAGGRGRIEPGLVSEVGREALSAGGKRLRPLLVFLASRPGEPPLAAGALPSSSCTWRRSSTTT